MLKKLHIKNFKIWQDTDEIRMAPITLFFGVNSSGKSSIGQFLMMLKQTIESPDRKVVFFSGDLHSAVQLGSFQEMVYRRDLERQIAFRYEWELSTPLKFSDPTSKKRFSAKQIAFEASVNSGNFNSGKIYVEHLKYQLANDDAELLSIAMKRNQIRKHQYLIEANGYQLKRNRGRVWNVREPVRFYGFPDEAIAYYQNADFVQLLNLEHEILFKSIFYLGPLRTRGNRIYSWTGSFGAFFKTFATTNCRRRYLGRKCRCLFC